jgi:hypothetical protein
MSSLTRRLDRLEEERNPDAESMQRAESLRQAIESARQRVKGALGYELPDMDQEASLLPGGEFGFLAALERGRERAKARVLEG